MACTALEKSMLAVKVTLANGSWNITIIEGGAKIVQSFVCERYARSYAEGRCKRLAAETSLHRTFGILHGADTSIGLERYRGHYRLAG